MPSCFPCFYSADFSSALDVCAYLDKSAQALNLALKTSNFLFLGGNRFRNKSLTLTIMTAVGGG